MTAAEEERRIYKRKQLSLPVRVSGHDSVDSAWTEYSHLIDVSPFGARFTISRLTEVGRLLHVLLVMPRQYRCFDHAEDQYRIWSLVRHVTLVQSTEAQRLDLGVAFVGKHAPASYALDPLTRYEVVNSETEGQLWDIREHSHSRAGPFTSERRDETRYQVPIEVLLEVIETSGEVIKAEKTVTEEISHSGTSVFTTFKLAKGQFVRLTSPQYQITITAVVRACYSKSDNFTRLGLEFIGAQWPLSGIE